MSSDHQPTMDSNAASNQPAGGQPDGHTMSSSSSDQPARGRPKLSDEERKQRQKESKKRSQHKSRAFVKKAKAQKKRESEYNRDHYQKTKKAKKDTTETPPPTPKKATKDTTETPQREADTMDADAMKAAGKTPPPVARTPGSVQNSVGPRTPLTGLSKKARKRLAASPAVRKAVFQSIDKENEIQDKALDALCGLAKSEEVDARSRAEAETNRGVLLEKIEDIKAARIQSEWDKQEFYLSEVEDEEESERQTTGHFDDIANSTASNLSPVREQEEDDETTDDDEEDGSTKVLFSDDIDPFQSGDPNPDFAFGEGVPPFGQTPAAGAAGAPAGAPSFGGFGSTTSTTTPAAAPAPAAGGFSFGSTTTNPSAGNGGGGNVSTTFSFGGTGTGTPSFSFGAAPPAGNGGGNGGAAAAPPPPAAGGSAPPLFGGGTGAFSFGSTPPGGGSFGSTPATSVPEDAAPKPFAAKPPFNTDKPASAPAPAAPLFGGGSFGSTPATSVPEDAAPKPFAAKPPFNTDKPASAPAPAAPLFGGGFKFGGTPATSVPEGAAPKNPFAKVKLTKNPPFNTDKSAPAPAAPAAAHVVTAGGKRRKRAHDDSGTEESNQNRTPGLASAREAALKTAAAHLAAGGQGDTTGDNGPRAKRIRTSDYGMSQNKTSESNATSNDEEAALSARLFEFYNVHNPEKLEDPDFIAEKVEKYKKKSRGTFRKA